MSLKDLDGRDINTRKLPKLLDRGSFEGEVDWKFHRNAVEYAGVCQHCGGVVAGVLALEDPALHKVVRPLREMVVLQKQCAEIMRARHQCSVHAEGKTDAADWLRQFGKA